MPPVLVLLRHGQSTWNAEQRFTGWTDVPLTPLGEQQAAAAGESLRAAGFSFHSVWTSELRRATRTAGLALAAMQSQPLERRSTPRLNERNFGVLEGMKFEEASRVYGPEWGQPWLWGLRPSGGESLDDLSERVVPVLDAEILPAVREGRSVLVVAHGNTIRALDERLRNGSGTRLDSIPPATPLIYDLTRDPVSRRFLET